MYPIKPKTSRSKQDLETNPEESAILIEPELELDGEEENTKVEGKSCDCNCLPVPASVIMISKASRSIVKAILKMIFLLIIKLWKGASSFAIVIFFVSWFYGGVLPYIVCVFGVLSLSYHFSDTLLYQPEQPKESRTLVHSPSSFRIPYETVYIQTPDRVKLHAYLIKQEKPRTRPVIIYFHGNAGNIGHRLDNARQLYHKTKCNILMVEYRGYGLSEGTPSETGFYQDAKASYEFVVNREDLNSANIILFGRSLGGAVAIDLAARCDFRDRIRAMIVENTFTSIPEMAQHLFPIRAVKLIPNCFFKSRFESSRKITSVVCPTLFISGSKDELIPPKMMIELHNRCAAADKKLVTISEGTHNDTWTMKGYNDTVYEFIEQVSRSSKEIPTEYQSYNDISIV